MAKVTITIEDIDSDTVKLETDISLTGEEKEQGDDVLVTGAMLYGVAVYSLYSAGVLQFLTPVVLDAIACNETLSAAVADALVDYPYYPDEAVEQD